MLKVMLASAIAAACAVVIVGLVPKPSTAAAFALAESRKAQALNIKRSPARRTPMFNLSKYDPLEIAILGLGILTVAALAFVV
jgi:hypothetical protein